MGAVAAEARHAVTRVVGDRVDTERWCGTVAVVHVTLVQVYNTPTTTSTTQQCQPSDSDVTNDREQACIMLAPSSEVHYTATTI